MRAREVDQRMADTSFSSIHWSTPCDAEGLGHTTPSPLLLDIRAPRSNQKVVPRVVMTCRGSPRTALPNHVAQPSDQASPGGESTPR